MGCVLRKTQIKAEHLLVFAIVFCYMLSVHALFYFSAYFNKANRFFSSTLICIFWILDNTDQGKCSIFVFYSCLFNFVL